ncbi:MAG: ComF family protein [Bacteroides sp.]|nr:ComF family protein [Bacteroides sp.]
MILRDAFDLIFPRTCHICGAPLDDSENFVCQPCVATLPRTGYHSQPDNRFEERFAGRFSFDRGASLFFYDRDGDLAKLVHDFKYRGYSSLAREMGRIMARELLPTGFLDRIEIIVPVGMHRLKRWQRGYNQATELARGLAETLNTTLSPNTGTNTSHTPNTGTNRSHTPKVEVWDCLAMNRYHRSQTRRTAEERAKSMRNIFRVKKGYDLTARTILLLDDICTTGSTLAEAAEALSDTTPKLKLRLLTLASTY